MLIIQCIKYVCLAYLSFDINHAMQIDKKNVQASAPPLFKEVVAVACHVVELEVEPVAMSLPEHHHNVVYHSYLRDCCQGINHQCSQCIQGCSNEYRYVQESCHACNKKSYCKLACMRSCCCPDNDDTRPHICIRLCCHPYQLIQCQEGYYNNCCYVNCCFNPCDRLDSCFFRQSCTGRLDEHPDVYCCLKDEENYLISCLCITPMMPCIIPVIIVSQCCLT